MIENILLGLLAVILWCLMFFPLAIWLGKKKTKEDPVDIYIASLDIDWAKIGQNLNDTLNIFNEIEAAQENHDSCPEKIKSASDSINELKINITKFIEELQAGREVVEGLPQCRREVAEAKRVEVLGMAKKMLADLNGLMNGENIN